jgi:hypothetical protein
MAAAGEEEEEHGQPVPASGERTCLPVAGWTQI